MVIPPDANLTQLDNTLRMFVSFTATYHGECVSCLVDR